MTIAKRDLFFQWGRGRAKNKRSLKDEVKWMRLKKWERFHLSPLPRIQLYVKNPHSKENKNRTTSSRWRKQGKKWKWRKSASFALSLSKNFRPYTIKVHLEAKRRERSEQLLIAIMKKKLTRRSERGRNENMIIRLHSRWKKRSPFS